MKASRIIDRLIDCISETVDIEKEALTPEASFEDDLGLDSLDLAEITMAIESAFDISIRDEDVLEIKTINDAIKHLITRIPCEVDIPLSFAEPGAEKQKQDAEAHFSEDENRDVAELLAESAAERSEDRTKYDESTGIGKVPALSHIADRVAAVIAPILKRRPSEIDPASSFRNHHDITADRIREIRKEIEWEFKVDITDNDMLHIQRVSDLMECTAWKLNADIDVHFRRFGPPTPWHKAWEKEARRFDEIEESLKIKLPRNYIGAIWMIEKYIKADKGGDIRVFLDPQEIGRVNKEGRRNKDWDSRVFAFACERDNQDNVFVIDVRSRNSTVMRMADGDADTAEEAASDLRAWIVEHIPDAKLDLPQSGASTGCAGVLAVLALIVVLSLMAAEAFYASL